VAQIVKYTAQQGLQAPSLPNTTVRSYEGAALQGLGSALSDVAAAFVDQNEKKEDFKAQDGYRRLQLRLDDDMRSVAENMAEDGTDFHKDFMASVYTPARNEFLSGLPPRLRERYETMLGDQGSDTEAWSIKSATVERDRLYSWYDNTLNASKEQLATAISMDPEAYDALLEQGLSEIESSGLTTDRKVEHRKQWERMAQVSHLRRMIETRPEEVLRDLGADPRLLSPSSQYELLRSALIQQESSGRASVVNAESGAVGLMQVMPDTARDIAKGLRDPDFDHSWSKAQITEYLSNPDTNQRYGDYYLRQQIRAFARTGGLEAALIAYHSGPERAKKWVESGFNDNVLGPVGRKYYKEVLARLPGLGKSMGADATADGSRSNPANVKIEWSEGRGGGRRVDDNVNPDLVKRVQASFAALGIDRVQINSGHRSSTANRKAGGATGSQHLHGNAFDINVTGYSRAERVNIIRALSANGVTGLGIGSNIIHADLGGRRAWGYAKASGGAPVPAWAKEAIDEHLENRATAPAMRTKGPSGRYASLPYSDRQSFIAEADRAVTSIFGAQAKASAVEKQEMRTAVRNDIASLTATGQSTGLVDETAVSTVLGEDDYMRYIADRDRALRTFEAKDGIPTMSLEDMDQRLQDYEPEAGSPTFAADQQVKAALEKEINRVQNLRAKKPEEAAREFPDVREAYDAIDFENPDPGAVQEYVRLTLGRQKDFGIKPGSEEPVPRTWAMEIGRALGRLPELAGRNSADVQTAIMVQYDALERVFGEYTDEVILYALSEYKGVGPNTSKLIGGMMNAIAAGGDPFARLRQTTSQAEDADQVERFGYYDYFGGGEVASRLNRAFYGGEDPGPEARDDAVDREAVVRATRAIQNLGDDLDPAAEAELRARYGDKVYDAAISRLGGD